MVFDGDCGFCRRWIARWRAITADRVDYAPSQEVAERFPEIPPEAFKAAVQFIETDGVVTSGAEAVFRGLFYAPGRGYGRWVYEHVPGAAPVTETVYRYIAAHRRGFSTLTGLFWGKHLEPSTFFFSRWLFLRLLGLIYLIAFVSLWGQIDGLIGSEGILPVKPWLDLVYEHRGRESYWLVPTLCWFKASDQFLHVLCAAGVLASGAVIAGFTPAPFLILAWVFYLSLASVSGVFLHFQWDILLLETGLLAILFAPWRILPRPSRERPPSTTVRLLFYLLLFRLMFGSGLVKLTSGDTTWHDLTALQYHYETQPLPPWTAWYAHQLPAWFQKTSVFIMFVIELGAPFLIFGPRRLKTAAFVLLVGLQLLIAGTGNYCFFNLLSIALCLLLLDDAMWPRRWREMIIGPAELRRPPAPRWRKWLIAPFATVVLTLSLVQIAELIRRDITWPKPITALCGYCEPIRAVNSYGLFRVMTTSRPEIIIEGSNDGREWRAYEFKWKPGDVRRRPRFVAPHQPRLDWQMWFAALGHYQHNPWLIYFMRRLLEGSRPVLNLLERNPFPDGPPRYLRAVVYDYHFTDFKARRETGAWWRRELKGLYCPVLSRSRAWPR